MHKERSLIGLVSGGGAPSERWQASGPHARELIRSALLKLNALAFIQCAQGHIAITEEGRRALQDLPVVSSRPREVSATYTHLWALAAALRAEYVPRLGQFCRARFAEARAITKQSLPIAGSRAWQSALQIWRRKVAQSIRSGAASLDYVLVQLARAWNSRAGTSAAVRETLPRQIGVRLSKVAKVVGRRLNAKPYAGAILLLLMCGGLSLAGGLVFSSGKPADSSRAAESAFLSSNPAEHSRESPIVWLHDGQGPLGRSILVTRRLEGANWIEGFAIRGENASNQPLSGLEGVIKTDSGEEIKLRVRTEGSQGKQMDARDVPAGSKFTLESAFHPDAASDQSGMPVEDFLSKYGGLILRVNCTLGSVQTTLIEYFSTAKLRAQLADAS